MPVTKAETRQSLLDAARRLVVTKGYTAVGINTILTEAGVPKGSFYHHFDSKDAFGEAMLQSYFDEYLTTMDAIVADSGKNSAEHLRKYWQNFYDTQVVDNCQGGCLVVKLSAEIADLSEVMRLATKAGTTAIVDRLERMIIAGTAEGSVSVDDTPRTTAEALYNLWLGASVMAKIHRSAAYLDHAMALTLKTLHLPS
ncbi:TetR/AcrR family transcriptional regulator [Streptomyces sp. TG1A-8]|uniref:TetR/AcrR family transcriptional regulator n=1 Tax=Streptomyces sp. TG1A-8 TaxID=3051385 RepID=UPI00265B7CDD|nr:TetR/AcrR family transcriptional regulator [Streptomyces sp. TG1A-8]MDO0929663.1 TetR/AcrR family transcriptional regulator [Streptomyces sp. TG1A-8]